MASRITTSELPLALLLLVGTRWAANKYCMCMSASRRILAEPQRIVTVVTHRYSGAILAEPWLSERYAFVGSAGKTIVKGAPILVVWTAKALLHVSLING